jgi:hypothetical protein
MERRRRFDRSRAARLARSYLAVRAEQVSEQQPASGERDPFGTVAMPRLDVVHLNSQEALAQLRLVVLARNAVGEDSWFTLARTKTPER